ncbi:6-pyruvoyl trahydropterin synthase family protein [Algisphaera agarilytica]|uniref:6-carboxy-5,6,7,8-tetrahydropterin synthase n=1 Tax=Algisphaera agarilytica TaxID=1385975 RepID=A0A7X0H7D8_9BACT|nr:6-carboxytetrahydropterin synthase [Algisphaera agarilytica]MBB6429486.1 6-pyruvoyltetrahydropterin/6-carboxytetrahydropterin synthase [Algisphaera agarilytica]
MYEATIEKTFSAAHALRLPDGTLEPLHGHDWLIKVTVASEGLDEIDTVMDFHKLQDLVEQRIAPWRNQNLNAVAPFANKNGELTVNPSAERVAEQIAWTISGQIPDQVWLKEVSVGEAVGCTARYRP